MNSKVRITQDKDGNIISVSQNNPEYGYVRVEQDCITFTADSWLKKSTRSALIHGKVEDLEQAKFTPEQELPGKIIILESHEPFDLKNPDRNLKIAGDTGIVCRVGDQPIYRDTVYTTNMNAQDELIMHTNSDEIREVQMANKMLSKISRTRTEVADL